MTKKLVNSLVITGLLLSTSASYGESKININSYLEEVKNNNPAYKASLQAIAGAKLRSNEGDILTLPLLSLEASESVDETEGTNSSFVGIKNTKEIYSASITQNTPFGLAAKLSFNNNYYRTEGASSAFLPPPYDNGYNRASPSLELTQSLWKNAFGSEVRAESSLITAGAQATQYAEKAKNMAVIIEAQNTYYKLYYTQKTVAALQDSMAVANKLKTWAKKRLDQALGEQSDYYQTKTAYELRELEYLSALQDEKAAARAFNSLRSNPSDTVSASLDAPSPVTYTKQNFSEKIWRDDARAAQKLSTVAKATSILGKERARPTLDLIGKYAWNGLDENGDDARNESLHGDHPSYLIGLKFTTSLAFGFAYKIAKAYEIEAAAADLSFKRKVQEQERDYNDLISKIENANLRLKLSSTLEESQRIKVQAERKRHNRGRTTFFQVLQFEQDYLSSQLNKIKTEAELSTLLTQLQMYREE